MEYPVYWEQVRTGTVSLQEREGRLWADMRCRRDDSGLFRGYLVGRRGEWAMGVLEPERDTLRARRVLTEDSRAALGEPLRGEMRLSYSFREREQWRQVEESRQFFRRGEFVLEEAEGALWRPECGLRLLALPFDCGRPFPLCTLFCFARIREIDGKLYAVFTFDQEENPVMEG